MHVPFCAHTCPYCHFYNIGHDDGREALFVDALRAEIEAWREAGVLVSTPLATLYFGGGTPSMLTSAGFDAVAQACLEIGPAATGFEWTVEMNPGDVSRFRLDRYRQAGVNRLSIGAQSFQSQRLEFLDRRHDAEMSLTAIERASDAGFENVSIDLMFNLAVPRSREEWLRDLEVAVRQPIVHVSLYGLTIEPSTAFGSRARRGATLTQSDNAFAREYREACEAMAAAGFEHYEVSAFARPGYRARHNAAYWSGAPYLGLGPSAHSFDGLHRWANHASLRQWADAVTAGGEPRAFVESLSAEQRLTETLYLGLRTVEGVPLDHPCVVGNVARGALQDRGLVGEKNGRLACTEEGFLVFDSVVDRLLQQATCSELKPGPTAGSFRPA